MDEFEAEKRHSVIVEDLMKEVQGMQRSNATLLHDGGHPRASSSYTPRPKPIIRVGSMWTFEMPPIDPSNTRGSPILKPVVELPYRLDDIERVATDQVEHIEGYAKGLVARAKLDTAQDQGRKAKKNKKKVEEVQGWMFWKNQQKLYEVKEREATEELQKLGAPANLGRTGLQVLQAGTAAVASFNHQED